MKTRHQARIIALQALFEIDIAHHRPGLVLQERIESQDPPLSTDAADFARNLVHGVVSCLAQLDQVIARFAPEWPVDQIAVIDRNILRLALWELSVGETPIKVAINEAVELAKDFGADSSPRFVNGVLGAASRQENSLRAMLLSATAPVPAPAPSA